MIDRLRAPRSTRPRPEASRRRRLARRPIFEPLEGRSLLSTVGSPDYAYAVGNDSASNGFSTVTTPGLSHVLYGTTGGFYGAGTHASAFQSDGKAVAVGFIPGSGGGEDLAVERLNADGTIDTTFGTNGFTTVASSTSGVNIEGEAVAIQSTGQIVVAADTRTSFGPVLGRVSVYRFNADGSLDTTFGTNGSVSFSFESDSTDIDQATAVAVGADGDIVVGGDIYGTPAGYPVALAEVTPGGALNTSFGTGGIFLPTFANTSPAPSSTHGSPIGVDGLAVLTDGSVVFDTTLIPTGASLSTGGTIAVGKLTPSGAFDSTFGTGGQLLLGTTDGAGGLAVQSDGKIVVTGDYNNDDGSAGVAHLDVYRLNTDGSPDTTFGTGGEATPNPATYTTPLFAYDIAGPVLVQSDGTILLGALTSSPTYSQSGIVGNSEATSILALNPDGSTDINFGADGKTNLPPNWAGALTLQSLGVQPDGKILVGTYLGVGRLLASGASDDFDEDGISDPTVLMPNFSSPIFAYRPSSGDNGGNDVLVAYGTAGAGLTLPAPGDYDGSGIDELGVYLPQNGLFAYRPYGDTGSQATLIQIGTPGVGNSIPAVADYLGLGFDQAGVYEPATDSFVYTTNNTSNPSSFVTIPFGTPGAGNSIPVPADYDGSGHDEIAVYLPQLGAFAYRPYGTTGADDQIIGFGSAGYGNSIPVPGDYDGSGHTELAVYLPALGAFAIRPYGTTGSQDQIIPFGIPGAGQSIPVPGDYDGSGHTELAVYIPSLDILAYRPYGTDGPDKYISFGQQGAGNSYPFNSAGTLQILADATGGSGGGSPSVKAAAVGGLDGYVDFVPDIAGQAKKKGDSGPSSTQS